MPSLLSPFLDPSRWLNDPKLFRCPKGPTREGPEEVAWERNGRRREERMKESMRETLGSMADHSCFPSLQWGVLIICIVNCLNYLFFPNRIKILTTLLPYLDLGWEYVFDGKISFLLLFFVDQITRSFFFSLLKRKQKQDNFVLGKKRKEKNNWLASL